MNCECVLALTAPAISAFYLDITARQHRSRVIGFKEASLSLGGVLGPLLVVVATRYTSARGVFLIAGGLMLVSVLLALLFLRSPQRRPVGEEEVALPQDGRRSQAAEATLRGLVLQATRARGIERG